MLERFERPLKIVCLGLAALLVFQVASVVFRGDPLSSVKIPDLPSLPGGTNENDKLAKQGTNAPDAKKASTNGTNAMISGTATNKTNLTASGATTNRTNNAAANTTNASIAKGTNDARSTNTVKHADLAKGTNAANAPDRTNATSAADGKTNAAKPHPGGPPGDMMAQMMGGGMPGMLGRPGGRRGGGAKPVTLPAETQARVDRIIESEILGPAARPVPMALVGISDDEAFIRATNGQTGPIKIGGEMAGIKLLRVALNRVLVEQDGEKKELTLFGGIGSESLMPKAPDSSTNSPAGGPQSTNAPSTNSAAKRRTLRGAAAKDASTNLPHSSEQKEAP